MIIELCDGFSETGPLNVRPVVNLGDFSGKFARALITKEVPDVESVSVEIKALR